MLCTVSRFPPIYTTGFFVTSHSWSHPAPHLAVVSCPQRTKVSEEDEFCLNDPFCILKAAPILTLRITWSKLISFFLGLDTATSSLTVGLSNLFMKLSEILPGSKALKPATCGVRNASSSRRWMLFMHQSICSMRLIVHQLWGYAKNIARIANAVQCHS